RRTTSAEPRGTSAGPGGVEPGRRPPFPVAVPRLCGVRQTYLGRISMSQDGTEVIEHVAAQNRFTITVDGTQAGFAAYRDTELGRAFDHTEVDPAFGGRGLAGKVVAVALDEAVEAG